MNPLDRNCLKLPRRDCLRLGLGALVGGGLAHALGLRATAQSGDPLTRRANNCIFVWMDGGPSHFETFDPKPDAPRELRGEFGVIPTRTPGVLFSEYLPRLAEISNKFTIVRSICHEYSSHGAGIHYMLTGSPVTMPVGCDAYVSLHPSYGSAVAHERSGPRGLPAYFSIPEMARSGGPSFLGGKYAPFVVGDDPNRSDFRLRDVALPPGIDAERFARRRAMRAELDRLPRLRGSSTFDPVAASDAFYQQSYDLVASSAAQRAFDLNREPAHVRDAYGRTPFGQRALLARRLVEAGVPFVTLYDGGWDSHADIFPTLREKLPPFEHTLAALINDLDERGLLETTLVVALGEFGRAPKITTVPTGKTPGRDHWAAAMSVLVAGAGTPRGRIFGATDRHGTAAIENVYSPENFASTIYRKLGIDPAKTYAAADGRPVHLVSDPAPIRELDA